MNDDPRYPVWLKSDPARLANPDTAEYQRIFDGQLAGVTVVNAVLCSRSIRALLLDNEQKAPSRSQERLIYRHGSHAIATVLMKRLRNRIRATTPMDAAAVPALVSQPLDQLRQEAFDLAKARLIFEGPLAYFRNQGNVGSYLVDLMTTNYGLASDPAIEPLRNVHGPVEAYPRKRLIDYLASRAPQI